MFTGWLEILNPINVIDITIVALITYKIIGMFKETRAVQLLKGLLLIVVVGLISELIGLTTVSWILKQARTVILIAIPVVFQPELRRGLEYLGNSTFWNPTAKMNREEKHVEEIVNQLMPFFVSASKSKTGVLLAIQKEVGLNEYVATGIRINGQLSTQLLGNIFIVNTPLHDGAVILHDDTILAASCYLPLSENKQISKALGTRHRAAIGLSEVSDAIVCVVSEETGAMSIAKDGKLMWNLSEEMMRKRLLAELAVSEQKSWFQRWRDDHGNATEEK